MRRCLVSVCTLATLLGLMGGAAHAGDFVDTRLDFSIVNENVLVKPGQTDPSIPGWHIGLPNKFGILFFDNYDTRYTGYENLTHLVVYKKFERGRVTAEAALVLRLLEFTDINISDIDDGSYIRLTYWFDKERVSKTNLALTVFPLNSDRMRLGYSYRISYGGSPIFFKFNPDLPVGAAPFVTNTQPAPGAKLQLSGERYYAYVGAKTSQILNRNPDVLEQVAVYAFLAGVGGDAIANHLRIEANGGYFDRGTNPLFFGTAVGPSGMTFTDYPVATFGGTVQVSAFSGISPTQSADFTLYRSDPLVTASRYFQRPVYLPGFNWLVSSEFTGIGTTLQNADQPNSTKIQPGFAGDVNLRAQVGHLRLKADFETRSLSFVLVNQPSLVPYQDFPNGSKTGNELFGSIGFDYLLSRIGMTIGATLGVQMPAYFTPPGLLPAQLMGNTGGTLSTGATVVVRAEGDLSILPATDKSGRHIDAAPIAGGKLEVREDFFEYFAALFQAYYEYDPNLTTLTKAADGSSIRNFNHPNSLGFTISLQARY